MRIMIGGVFIILYILWVIYRGLIKRDIKQHKTDFYALTFFISVWLLIYYFIFF